MTRLALVPIAANVPTYSAFVDAAAYNRMMTDEHLYIADADRLTIDLARDLVGAHRAEVLEVGCGPGRLLGRAAGHLHYAHVSGIDIDNTFLRHARATVRSGVDILYGDAAEYRHGEPIDVALSMGFHHHVPKGSVTRAYLRNVASQLAPRGVYFLADEFLPRYVSETERRIAATIWYAHIISSAIAAGFRQLAEEEAKTLLDDLTGGDGVSTKTPRAIEEIIDRAGAINAAAMRNHRGETVRGATRLLAVIDEELRCSSSRAADVSMTLSRGDFKISTDALAHEVADAGLEIVEKHRIGPAVDIGALMVVVLRRCR